MDDIELFALFDPDEDVLITERNLPHWEQTEAKCAATSSLALSSLSNYCVCPTSGHFVSGGNCGRGLADTNQVLRAATLARAAMRLHQRSTRLSFWAFILILFASGRAEARIFRRVADPSGRFSGQVVDFTHNHGVDRRIWSSALGEKRDLYVYLPPGFDPAKKYPVVLWLHGIEQDERGFLEVGLPEVDAAMACGTLTPAIVAIPDGSVRGRPGYFSAHSGFLDTRAGCYEAFLFDDVYDFVCRNFPVRPEREAHVLAGASIGGGSAFLHAIKRRAEFGVVMGMSPPLNFRWQGPHGCYFANFDPERWGWREHYHLGLLPVGKFFGGLVNIPWRRLIHPLYGDGNQVVAQLSRDNPIELLERHGLKEGELQMLVAYGGRDEFNIDAQVESFLFTARGMGLTVHALHQPRGRHNTATALRFVPDMLFWLDARLQPFQPK